MRENSGHETVSRSVADDMPRGASSFTKKRKRAGKLSRKNARLSRLLSAIVVEADDENGYDLFFSLAQTCEKLNCAVVLAADSDGFRDKPILWVVPGEEFVPLERDGRYDFSIRIYPEGDRTAAVEAAKALGAEEIGNGKLSKAFSDIYELEKFAVGFARGTFGSDAGNGTYTTIVSEKMIFPLYGNEELKKRYFAGRAAKKTHFDTRAGEIAQNNRLIATGTRNGDGSADGIIRIARRFAEEHNG